jgi:D-glycero-D-manno-heptose 1,7-bisphosphate phosphatase
MRFETVFLDRDGVINAKAAEDDYVKSWDAFHFLPGAAPAIGLLAAAARRVIVVTNQRGIARGRLTAAQLAEIHQRMGHELARYGGRLDAIYHCPHDRQECSCRKPATGMLEQARLEHPGLDFSRSVLVGDSLSDLQCGAAAGCPVILIGSGQRAAGIAGDARQQGISLLAVCDSLYQAVAGHILRSPAAAAV